MEPNDRHTQLRTDPLLLAAVAELSSTTGGRYFLASLLAGYGVRQSTFDSDPHLHAFRSGVHNAGLVLEDLLITASPDNYILMLKERTDEN